jgi:hypothetical protein
MAKLTRRKVKLPFFQAGDRVSTRYGTGVILHAFVGSIHYNRQTTYSVEIKGLIKPRVLFERELTACEPMIIAVTSQSDQPNHWSTRPHQLTAA